MKTHDVGRLLLIVITFVVSIFSTLGLTHAQTATILSVEPSQILTGFGGQVSLSLNVTNGVNVNAYDIILEYDPNLVELTTWTHGGFLSNLAIVVRTQQPGYFRLVCTQLATPPVSGNGVLLNLTFRALVSGLSNVEITGAEFADSSGNKILPTKVNGQIQIDSNPVYTTTPTATATAIRTATLPVEPSATQTRTVTSILTVAPTAMLTTAVKTNTPVPTQPGLPTRSDTRPVYPITTPQAGQVSIPMLRPSQGMNATQMQITPPAALTTAVAQDLGQTMTPIPGMTTDPVFIPVRPENSLNPVQGEVEDPPNRILIVGIILFGFIALAFVLYLVWKRR